jgi:hypothetical protein
MRLFTDSPIKLQYRLGAPGKIRFDGTSSSDNYASAKQPCEIWQLFSKIILRSLKKVPVFPGLVHKTIQDINASPARLLDSRKGSIASDEGQLGLNSTNSSKPPHPTITH